MKSDPLTALGLLTVTLFASVPARLTAADAPSIFDRQNISALWIAPPWDAKKRGPEERMQMLKELGLSKFAYNGGSAVDAEIEAAKKHGISNVGIVFNFHHWRGSLAEFPALFKRIQPYLIAVNLNGMSADTTKYPPVRMGAEGTASARIRRAKAARALAKR